MPNTNMTIQDSKRDQKEHESGAGLRARVVTGLPVVERRLELNGLSTSVLEGGEGPPVVLLHGPGEYGASWLRVIPSLVRTHRVIAPDLPGHGTSAAVDVPLDVGRLVGWVDRLIDCTCSAPPVLCGQTLGGAIAARYASAHSERLRGLVLVDALGLTAFQPVPEFGMALGEFMAHPSEGSHDRLWEHCAFDLEAMRGRMGDTWERLKAYNLDRASATELKGAQQSLMQHFGMPAIPTADLTRISVPTSLIWGKYDRATPLAIPKNARTSVDERLDWVVREITRMVAESEVHYRTMLRLSLDPETPRESLGLRQGRAVAWIDEALAPLGLRLSRSEKRRLVLAIRAAIGIEAYVWLVDVAGLSRQDALETMRWSAKTLLRGALEGGGEGATFEEEPRETC